MHVHFTEDVYEWLGNDDEGQNMGIQWTLTSSLEDLVFVDDINMLSSRHRDIQDKSERLQHLHHNSE